MGRLMACNDETDGGRDKRDTRVRGHYSSAAHTHTCKHSQRHPRVPQEVSATSLSLPISLTFFPHPTLRLCLLLLLLLPLLRRRFPLWRLSSLTANHVHLKAVKPVLCRFPRLESRSKVRCYSDLENSP